jgi:hypothetical protein
MSYQEKRTIVNILTIASVLAAYCLYAFGQYQSGAVAAGDLKFWARTMLIFIGIGIGAGIVIQIVFHIFLSIDIAVKKKIQNVECDDQEIEKSIGNEMVEDEMGRLIELKSTKFGYAVAGIGFVAGIVSLLLNYSTVVMLNIFFISFNVGSIVDGAAQLYLFKRGVING